MTQGHFLLILIAALANVGLGATIVSRAPRSRIHQYFAVFSFSVAAWTLSNGLVSAFPDSEWGYIWGRLTFASASLIPVAFLYFTSVFPTTQPPAPRAALTVFLIAALVALLSSLTPLIVRATESVDGHLHVQYGPLHFPFGLYFVACLGLSLFLLAKKLFLLTGLQRLQVRYLLTGVLTAAVGATIANLIIPLVYGSSQFSSYGPLFGMLMIAVVAHSIIRHRLMDIKVVVRQGVVYVCAIVVVASIFVFLVEAFKRIAGYEKDTIPLPAALTTAIILAIFFQPLKNWMQGSFNRYLYRHTYDYHRTIREASRRLSTMLELNPLLDYLSTVIEHTFEAEMVGIYLHDPSTKTFILRGPTSRNRWPHGVPRPAIAQTSALLKYLSDQQNTLVREEVTHDTRGARLREIGKELGELGADVAFPLTDSHTVVGLIIVGPKRSGDPYFSGDIDLLETLIAQAAVAMKNAQLYRQVVLVNEYVDNILSTMESGVIAVNSAGEISLFNQAAERLTGLTAVDLRGNSYRYLAPSLALPLRDALEAKISRSQFETSIDSQDRTAVPLVCSTAILTQGGAPGHGALIVFSDLSRVKDLEREKRRAERLAAFGALASGVAHEIKNPLVAIRTFAELLPERFAEVDFREDFAKVVIREIGRIDDLIGRLRGIAATAPQHVGPIDIREPVTDTLRLLRAQLEQTHTAVHHDFENPPTLVAVDEAQLKQLFLNLFLNAIEAMGSGGELTVRIARRELRGAYWVVVEVWDTGPGIPERVKASIFDPFFTTKSRGSGLGLAICRGIADAHRGAIRAESRKDRSGTIVVVELPAVTETSLHNEERLLQR